MNCLNMHHPVSSLAPVCLKLLATHPAEPGIWHDLRIAGGAIVPMSGRGCRAPLAVATDRWQLSGMSSWAQPDFWRWWFLETSDAGLCSNVFESCCEKQAHGLGLQASFAAMIHWLARSNPTLSVQMGLHFSSSVQDSTGKALTR